MSDLRLREGGRRGIWKSCDGSRPRCVLRSRGALQVWWCCGGCRVVAESRESVGFLCLVSCVSSRSSRAVALHFARTHHQSITPMSACLASGPGTANSSARRRAEGRLHRGRSRLSGKIHSTCAERCPLTARPPSSSWRILARAPRAIVVIHVARRR